MATRKNEGGGSDGASTVGVNRRADVAEVVAVGLKGEEGEDDSQDLVCWVF